MTPNKTCLVMATLAFAAGVAVGVSSGRVNHTSSQVDLADATRITGDSLPRENEEGAPPETIVEVVYADTASESPSSEITAAHRARQANRAAERAAKAEKRRDFFSRLNLNLLTDEQRKLHAEYAEAVAARDKARREIRELRTKGEDVPAELAKRLADAESVIRADAAEEHRALREAAARAHGLDDAEVDALLEDIASIDAAVMR